VYLLHEQGGLLLAADDAELARKAVPRRLGLGRAIDIVVWGDDDSFSKRFQPR
jgi:hypothetical protein